MAIIETNVHFDTNAVRRMLNEYERDYRKHDQHLAVIVAQNVLLIKDAERLYKENERLSDENTRLNAKMSTRLYGINAADVKKYHDASVGLCMKECKRILVEQAREGEVDRLVNENVKLREAARAAWRLFVRHGAVEPCDLPEVDRVRQLLQELGIEVDE